MSGTNFRPFTLPVRGEETMCGTFKDTFRKALQPHVEEDDIEVEFFKDRGDLITKVRVARNEWLSKVSLDTLSDLLQGIREELDKRGFRTAKLICNIYPEDEKKSNIRIIYNPTWKGFRNYEIHFEKKS